MIEVVLYSRMECHLCEQAKDDLYALQDTIPHRLVEVNIDDNPSLIEAYGLEIPVVEVGPYKLRAPFTRKELQVTLSAAQDRVRHIEMVEQSPKLAQVRARSAWTGADQITYWISKHYMAMFNILVFIYVGLSFLAAGLMKANMETPANLLYKAYSVVCHQLAYRSIFLYGEQSFYPRAAAGVDGLLTYEQATGLGEDSSAEDIFIARQYVGDESVGYKVALCQRDVAIYASILLFGLIYPLTGRRLKTLPWYWWILIGIVPIGLDGFSQLLSQPPFNFWAFRESTPFLRILTGALFGFATAWFGYPLVEETMADTRQIMASKKARISQAAG